MEKSNILLMLSLILILALSSAAQAASITNFNNSLSTENLLYASAGNKTRYIDIYIYGHATFANITMSGYNLTAAGENDTEESYSYTGALYGVKPITNAVDENWTTYIEPAYAAWFYLFENTTVPSGVSVMNWTHSAGVDIDAGDIVDAWYYDYSNSSWTLLYDRTAGAGYGVYTNVASVPAGGFSQSPLQIKFRMYKAGDSVYYEGKAGWNGGVGGKASSSPNLEVGTPDGTYEWNYTGDFVTVGDKSSDFSTVFNTALNGGNCDCTGCVLNVNTGYCSIPYVFSSGSAGWLKYSSISVSYFNDTTAPFFQTDAQNETYVDMYDALNLSVQIKDTETQLVNSWIQTNESGSWVNNTGGTSLKTISGYNTWVFTNFSWVNVTLCNSRVGWRVCSKNSAGYQNCSVGSAFWLMPYINSSSNTAVSVLSYSCSAKDNMTFYQNQTGMTNWTLLMPYKVYNSTHKFCEYEMSRQYWYKQTNQTNYCEVFGRGRNIASTTSINIAIDTGLRGFFPPNLPAAIIGITIGTIIMIVDTIRKKRSAGYA